MAAEETQVVAEAEGEKEKAAAESAVKDLYQERIEDIFQDKIYKDRSTDDAEKAICLYHSLDAKEQERLKAAGEAAALAIRNLIESKKIAPRKIHDVIHSWLKTIPRVSPNFLLQEAKIKTDEIIKVAEAYKNAVV